MKIYKYELDVASSQEVRMSPGAMIIALQVQNGVPCIWAKIPNTPFHYSGFSEVRTFITVGTGHEFTETNLTYIGTYQQGPFVGHVFEQQGIR